MDYRGKSCTARDGKTKEHSKLCSQPPRIDLPWNGFYAYCWPLSGFTVQPEDLHFPTHKIVRGLIAALVVTLGILNTILDIPLIYYSSFVLLHRFATTNKTLAFRTGPHAKNSLSFAPLGLAVIEIACFFFRGCPKHWCFWAAGALLVFTSHLSTPGAGFDSPFIRSIYSLGRGTREPQTAVNQFVWTLLKSQQSLSCLSNEASGRSNPVGLIRNSGLCFSYFHILPYATGSQWLDQP